MTTPDKLKTIGIAMICLSLGSCVVSEKPLIVGAKPILGAHVSAVLFRDYKDGQGYSAQGSSFRWEDGFYVRAGADGDKVVKFAAEPLQGEDFILERTQDDRGANGRQVYAYFLGRRVAEGAYVGVPLDEDALSPAYRKTVCGDLEPGIFCNVASREQVEAIANATAKRALRDPSVVVLTPRIRD